MILELWNMIADIKQVCKCQQRCGFMTLQTLSLVVHTSSFFFSMQNVWNCCLLSKVFAILELVLNMKTIIVKYVCISKLPGKHDVVFISWNENEIFNSANIFLTKHLFIIQLVFYTEFVFIILWILLSYLSVVLSVLDVFDMMPQICLCHIQHHLHTLV